MPRLILFQTGNVNYALEMGCVKHMGKQAQAPMAEKGRVQLQTVEHEGQPVKLIDLAAALDQNEAALCPPTGKMIMIGGQPAQALWADKVKGFLTVDDQQMDDLPTVFTGTSRLLFPKVLRLDDRLVLVTDADALTDMVNAFGPKTPESRMVEQKEDAVLNPESFAKENACVTAAFTRQLEGHCLEPIIEKKLEELIARCVNRSVDKNMAKVIGRFKGQCAEAK